ncbi:hypothetical protein GJZ31_04670 [Salmonella enterica]|nr:hypothetical protein [Salmonella enterica]
MRNTLNVFLLLTAFVLAGCQSVKKTTVTGKTSTPVLSQAATAPLKAPGDEVTRKQLSTCLFEAEQLLKLDGQKYRQPVDTLYQHIRAAKYYASVSSSMSTGNTDTLTPMYQFKINDACNTVSQLLLSALKQGDMAVTGR